MPLTNFFSSGGRRGSNSTVSPNGNQGSDEGVTEPESPTARLGKRKRSHSDDGKDKDRAAGEASVVAQARSNAMGAVGALTPPPTSPVQRTYDVVDRNPQLSPLARGQIIADGNENDEYPFPLEEELIHSPMFERSSARVTQRDSIPDFCEPNSTGLPKSSDGSDMPRSTDPPTARKLTFEGSNKRLKISEKSVSFQEIDESSEQSASRRSDVPQMIEAIKSTLLRPEYADDDKLKGACAQLEIVHRRFQGLKSTENFLRSERMRKDTENRELRAKVGAIEAELDRANGEITDMKGKINSIRWDH
jgi:hypothetical protein